MGVGIWGDAKNRSLFGAIGFLLGSLASRVNAIDPYGILRYFVGKLLMTFGLELAATGLVVCAA